MGKIGPLLRLGGSIFLVVLMAKFLSGMAHTYRLANEVRRWPTTQGTVVKAEAVKVGSDEEGNDEYEARIRYRYEVNGQTYEGHAITLGAHVTGDRRSAERIVAVYPEGVLVRVYYNPRNPAEAALKPGVQGDFWLFLALMAAGLLIGVGGILYSAKEVVQSLRG